MIPEREKVQHGLECCYNNNCGACPYSAIIKCQHKLHSDALALLREQEPRVMTLEEVKQHDNKNNCVWFELPNNIIAAVFVIQDRTQTGIISPYVNSEPLIFHLYWNNTNYGKTWRCWTAKPTDEQRKAVKWDE